MMNLVFAISLLMSMAAASGGFPTVRELEAALSAQRGAEFPKLIVSQSGVFHAYYQGAVARGNGRYSVELQLRR